MTDNNPWLNMGKGVERKAKNTGTKQIFWITDVYGRYGISFRKTLPYKNADNIPKLRGILLEKRNFGESRGELNLVLSNENETELFLALCKNLISASLDFDTDDASVAAVENRLTRWQELLKKERLSELSIERQMGLYTELKCLQEIVIPQVGLKAGITSWVGADYDRQDFLLDDVAIEVKSHKTSKGEPVSVSSKYQLDSIKNKVVLISYALTFSETGSTVLDAASSIRNQINTEDPSALGLFEAKLLECDFAPELFEKPLQGFLIDFKKIYEVNEDFPRIESKDISSMIPIVKYVIELTYCAKFEINEDQIFKWDCINE